MDFQIPKIVHEDVDDHRGVFVIEPLDRGRLGAPVIAVIGEFLSQPGLQRRAETLVPAAEIRDPQAAC